MESALLGPAPWTGAGAHSSYFYTSLAAAAALKKAADTLGAGSEVTDATFKVKALFDAGASGTVGVVVRLFLDKPASEVCVLVSWPCSFSLCSPRQLVLCAPPGRW